MGDIVKLLIIFAGGIVGGFYGSSVGGGALISFPLLILVGFPVHTALGTQRLGAIFLEGASALRFHKAKKFNPKLAIPLGLVAAIGSIIGVTVVVHIDEKILNIIIGVTLCFIAFVLLNKEKIGIKEHALSRKHLVLLFLSMVPLGFYQGFFGAGFGVFIAMVLVLFGFSFLESAAVGRVIGACASVAGAVIFAQHGLINYFYASVLGVGFAIGSWVGVGFALKKNDTYIKLLILLVVLLSVIKLLFGFLLRSSF